MQLQIKGLPGRYGTGGERQVIDFVMAGRRPVIPDDLCIGDFDTADGQSGQRADLVCLLLVRLPCIGGRLALQILPVGAAVFIPGQAQVQAVQFDRIHLQFLTQQRQQLDPYLHLFHAGHGLVTKAGGITQLRGTDIQTQPGEYRQANITINREGTTGLFGNGCRYLVLVIIGVNEKRQRNDEHQNQSNHHCNEGEHELEQLSHNFLSLLYSAMTDGS